MNIFDVLSRGDSRLYEPSMSAMLGYLLDSSENHGLGSAFVKMFLEEVNSERFNDFLNNPFIDYRVSLEEEYELYGKTKYIDIQIDLFEKKTEKGLHRVIIENKIQKGAANEGQLKDYYDAVINKSDIEKEKITFVFLTPKCKSTKLDTEYKNLNISEEQKRWIYWDDNVNSISSILKQILLKESLGEIDPINEYVRHTLKAFRKYCIETFSASSQKIQQVNIGDEVDRMELPLSDGIFTVIKRDSGQIQVFDNEGERVPAKPVLIQYIEENENINVSYLKKDSTKCNTREIGRRLFVWHSENSKVDTRYTLSSVDFKYKKPSNEG